MFLYDLRDVQSAVHGWYIAHGHTTNIYNNWVDFCTKLRIDQTLNYEYLSSVDWDWMIEEWWGDTGTVAVEAMNPEKVETSQVDGSHFLKRPRNYWSVVATYN